MKSQPAISMVSPSIEAIGLSCPRPAPVNDTPQPSHVEWRLEPPPEAPPVEEPPPEAPAPSRRGAALASRDPGDATDADSAEQAYQLWKGRVWRFASRLGIPPEALEDATQDVFTAVFRRWSDFQGLSTRRTWVLGFVPRIASSYRRRERHRPEPAHDTAAPGVAPDHQPSGSSESDPFESTARREATRVVQAFLDGLPETDRQLFVLVDLEDASVVEAAAILQIANHRAYKTLDKIRRSLEATLVRHRAIGRRRLP